MGLITIYTGPRWIVDGSPCPSSRPSKLPRKRLTKEEKGRKRKDRKRTKESKFWPMNLIKKSGIWFAELILKNRRHHILYPESTTIITGDHLMNLIQKEIWKSRETSGTNYRSNRERNVSEERFVGRWGCSRRHSWNVICLPVPGHNTHSSLKYGNKHSRI